MMNQENIIPPEVAVAGLNILWGEAWLLSVLPGGKFNDTHNVASRGWKEKGTVQRVETTPVRLAARKKLQIGFVMFCLKNLALRIVDFAVTVR